MKYQVVKFKLLTGYGYREGWNKEQIGKNFTVYAGRTPNKNWREIISAVHHELETYAIRPAIRPPFDLPLRSPYWSARNESDFKAPEKYMGADEQWEFNYNNEPKLKDEKQDNIYEARNTLEKLSHEISSLEPYLKNPYVLETEKEKCRVFEAKRDLLLSQYPEIKSSPPLRFSLEYRARCVYGGIPCLEHPLTLSEKTIYLYDLTLMHAYKHDPSSVTELDKVIDTLASEEEIAFRKKQLFDFISNKPRYPIDDIEKIGGDIEKHGLFDNSPNIDIYINISSSSNSFSASSSTPLISGLST